jgi:hypothetical protein
LLKGWEKASPAMTNPVRRLRPKVLEPTGPTADAGWYRRSAFWWLS